MPIVVTCTNCDKKLRVPDDLLGKKVKCPGCGTIFLGKVADSAAGKDKPPTSVRSKERAPSKDDSDDDEEQTEEKSGGVQSKPSQKGSRPKDDDDEEPPERPSRAGKKTKDDEDEDEVPSKRRGRKDDDDDDDDDDTPSKRRKRKDDDDDDDDDDRPSRRRRFADDDDDDDDDDRPSRRGRRRGNYQAHKGAVILVLGILSVVCGIVICCAPLALFGGLGFGIPAWIMGQLDRRKMAAGQMDPAGHGMTTAGWICGIIGCSLGALQIFCFVLRIVGFAGANAFDNGFGH